MLELYLTQALKYKFIRLSCSHSIYPIVGTVHIYICWSNAYIMYRRAFVFVGQTSSLAFHSPFTWLVRLLLRGSQGWFLTTTTILPSSLLQLLLLLLLQLLYSDYYTITSLGTIISTLFRCFASYICRKRIRCVAMERTKEKNHEPPLDPICLYRVYCLSILFTLLYLLALCSSFIICMKLTTVNVLSVYI